MSTDVYSGCWRSISLFDICKFQISFSRRVGGRYGPLYQNIQGNRIECNPKTVHSIFFKIAAFLHIFLYSVKFLFAWHCYALARRGNHVKAQAGIASNFGLDLGVAGLGVTIFHYFYHNSELLAALLNSFGGDQKKNSNAIKFVALQAPLITISGGMGYAMIQFLEWWSPNHMSRKFTEYWRTLRVGPDWVLAGGRVLLHFYEWWNVIWTWPLGTLICFCGMSIGYEIIYDGVHVIHSRAKKDKEPIATTFMAYRRLQVFTGVINESFQLYAIHLKVICMVWAVLTTVLVTQEHIRTAMSPPKLALSIFQIAECYVIFIFAYTFPGRAHWKSRKVKKLWQRKLVLTRFQVNVNIWKRHIQSAPEIKIRFGSVNYYGRMTSLNVVQFVVEKSLKLMLLLKK